MQTILVHPLAHTEVSWSNFLAVASKTLDRKISKGKDSAGVGEWAAFISALEEMYGTTDPPIINNRLASASLRFLHFSFIVICPTETLLDFQDTDIVIRSSETIRHGVSFAVMSASLLSWKQTILALKENDPQAYRQILNSVLKYFEDNGLSSVFAAFSKMTLKDGTCTLLPKR